MNEARVINFALIGMFLLMLGVFVFAVQFSINIFGVDTVTTTVSAFCG